MVHIRFIAAGPFAGNDVGATVPARYTAIGQNYYGAIPPAAFGPISRATTAR